MPEQADFESLVPVNRYREPDPAPGLSVDVMASMDPQEGPIAVFQQPAQLSAGERSHTAISTTLPASSAGATSTDRHASTAS